MAGPCGRTLIDVLALVAVGRESSLAGASVGADGVETRGVDVARVVFTLVHVEAVHVFGRVVVTNAAGALERAVGVLALFVHATGIVRFNALVYILTKSLIDQSETWLAQAREGTLAVDTRGSVSAASIVDETLVDVAALRCPVSRISYLAGAFVGTREIDTKGIRVTLRHERALVHILAGETIAPVPCRALAGEGAGGICTDCVGAATSCHALIQVMALRVVKDKAKTAVTVE